MRAKLTKSASFSIPASDERISWQSILVGVVIGLAIAALVLARAILANDGYLTPDSMSYLALVQNLNQGHGFWVANEGYFPAGPEYFATWPVGYPLAIHFISMLAGLSPFMASKIVSMLAVTSCTGMVAASFGRTGAVAALPIAFAANLEIFSYSWSEVPFVFFLVSAAILFADLIGRPERKAFFRAILLAASCIGLFLCRYVGAFAISLIAVAALLAVWRRAYAMAIFNGLLLLGVAAFIWSYLAHNATLTGFSTGMPRTPAMDSPGHRLGMLAAALWHAAILPIAEFVPGYGEAAPRFGAGAFWLAALIEFAGLAALVAIVRSRYGHPLRVIWIDSLALSFLVVGALYLGAIITLRWLNQFDPYSFRLLGPGTLLIAIAVIRIALLSWPNAAKAISVFAAAMAGASAIIAVLSLVSLPGPGYLAELRAMERRYASVPSGTILIFGDKRLRYVRPDLFVAEPMCLPWFDNNESWDQFLGEIDRRRPIMVDMSDHALQPAGCQLTVRKFLSGHRAGELFRLTLPQSR